MMITSWTTPRAGAFGNDECIILSWQVGRCSVVVYVLQKKPEVLVGGGEFGMDFPPRDADVIEVEALANRFNSMELREAAARMRGAVCGPTDAGIDIMDEPQITRKNTAFSLTCAVEINFQADASVVWRLLTDAEGFPRWNSTVSRIEGHIREGERLRLHVPGTTRTFTPTVSGVIPDERMIWTGGIGLIFKGVRTFTLRPRTAGSTDFTMQEHFSGLMLPLVKGALPDFGPIFGQFASDLKREAESNGNSKVY